MQGRCRGDAGEIWEGLQLLQLVLQQGEVPREEPVVALLVGEM